METSDLCLEIQWHYSVRSIGSGSKGFVKKVGNMIAEGNHEAENHLWQDNRPYLKDHGQLRMS